MVHEVHQRVGELTKLTNKIIAIMIELKTLLDDHLEHAKTIGNSFGVHPAYLLAKLRTKGIFPDSRKNRVLMRTPYRYMLRTAFFAAFSRYRDRPAKLAAGNEEVYRTVLSLFRNYKQKFE